MQNLSATHVTAESAADVAELGLGLAVIVQLDPRHVSISGWKLLEAFTYDPTATQNVVRTHDTPDKAFEPTPASGLAVRDHTTPFHASTSVCRVVPSDVYPAATHAFGRVHDTASSSLSGLVGTGSNVDSIQPTPLKVSTIGWMCPKFE
jgi:hypothetical protein